MLIRIKLIRNSFEKYQTNHKSLLLTSLSICYPTVLNGTIQTLELPKKTPGLYSNSLQLGFISRIPEGSSKDSHAMGDCHCREDMFYFVRNHVISCLQTADWNEDWMFLMYRRHIYIYIDRYTHKYI